MRIIDRYDASDAHDRRTIFSVETDEDQTVDVMVKEETGLIYVMSPSPEDINEDAVTAFVREYVEIEKIQYPEV